MQDVCKSERTLFVRLRLRAECWRGASGVLAVAGCFGRAPGSFPDSSGHQSSAALFGITALQSDGTQSHQIVSQRGLLSIDG